MKTSTEPFKVGERLVTLPVRGCIPQLTEGEVVEVIEEEHSLFSNAPTYVGVRKPDGKTLLAHAHRFKRFPSQLLSLEQHHDLSH